VGTLLHLAQCTRPDMRCPCPHQQPARQSHPRTDAALQDILSYDGKMAALGITLSGWAPLRGLSCPSAEVV
jgi:hypothetical protein